MKQTTLLLLAALAPLASANTTYTYTGSPFTIIAGGGGSNYTTSDFVSGSFTMAAPLAASLALGNITPLTYSFSDGTQTFTNVSHPAGVEFQAATDASGNIDYWNIEIGYVSNNPEIETIYYTDPPEPSNVNEDAGVNSTGAGIENALPPGSWVTSNSGVPEPSSLVLLLLPLGCMVARHALKGAVPRN